MKLKNIILILLPFLLLSFTLPNSFLGKWNITKVIEQDGKEIEVEGKWMTFLENGKIESPTSKNDYWTYNKKKNTLYFDLIKDKNAGLYQIESMTDTSIILKGGDRNITIHLSKPKKVDNSTAESLIEHYINSINTNNFTLFNQASIAKSTMQESYQNCDGATEQSISDLYNKMLEDKLVNFKTSNHFFNTKNPVSTPTITNIIEADECIGYTLVEFSCTDKAKQTVNGSIKYCSVKKGTYLLDASLKGTNIEAYNNRLEEEIIEYQKSK